MVSLLAIVLAIYELVQRSRRVAVSLVVHCPAIASHEDGRLFFLVDIVNVGGELAIVKQLQVVNGVIEPHPDFQMGVALQPGSSHRIWIATPDETKVWFRFEWMRPVDTRFNYVAWRPMLNGDETEVSRKWDKSNNRVARRTWLHRLLLDRWPKAVHPDGVAFGRIRNSWNDRRLEKRLERIMPKIDEPIDVWKFGLMDPRPGAAAARKLHETVSKVV